MSEYEIQTVRVIDVDMSFGNMVGFMIKWAFAAIPALIFLGFIGLVGFFLLAGALGGLGAGLR